MTKLYEKKVKPPAEGFCKAYHIRFLFQKPIRMFGITFQKEKRWVEKIYCGKPTPEGRYYCASHEPIIIAESRSSNRLEGLLPLHMKAN